MFWLEPHEIVRMYEERTATFHSMNEGVIAIDNQHHITIFNEKAKQIFNVRQETDGRLIWDVLKIRASLKSSSGTEPYIMKKSKSAER